MTTLASSDLAIKGSVLVIDDSADTRLLLWGLLTRAGYRPLLGASSQAGLDILDHEVPALICVDSLLPGISGPELVRRIRERADMREVPIIVLAAEAGEAYVDAAFAAGADDYVVKPFDRRILLARIESVIRGARDRRRAAKAKAIAQQRDQLLADFAEASHVQRTQSAGLPRCFQEGTIMGTTLPCGHLGGDLITVVDGPGEATTAVLIDVSGHDASAALVASSVLVELQNLARTAPIAVAMAALNRRMTASRSEHYACVGAIQISGARATIVNAGLPPIVLVRNGRIAASVESCGVPPGMLADSIYDAVELELESDDRIAIMSDGMTEPLGDADDVERCLGALDLLVPRGMRTSDEFMRQVRALFGGRPLVDDATLILIDFWFDLAATAAARVPADP